MVLAQKTFSVRKNIHGKDGTPALTLAVVPSQLVFDTDESGAILTKVLSANTAKVGLYDGQTEVTAEKYNITPVNCTATLANGVLTITSVAKGAYSGRVDITATYKGNTRVGSVAFNVNANHVYDAKFEANEKAIEAIVSDTAVKEDGSLLSKAYSMFKMLSDKIRLFVTNGLKKTGIDIESGQIVATADNFKVKNSSGTETFLINEDGQITADNLSLDGLDAKDAVIKNLKMQSNYSLSPFFLTNETLSEFLAHAHKPYAGWGGYYAWPFDFASFIVIGSEEVITKKQIVANLDAGSWKEFTTYRNETKPEENWGKSFHIDYPDVPQTIYWLSLLGKTVMIANSTNAKVTFGEEISDHERYKRGHAPFDLMDLPDRPTNIFNSVKLCPNQIGVFKYVTVSGTPDFLKRDKDYKPKVYGVWLKQAVYDFNYTTNLIKTSYDVAPNFNIFEEKYLNLFGKKGHPSDYDLPKRKTD